MLGEYSSLFSQGTQLFEQERWAEAEVYFARAAQAVPGDAPATHNRALCLERMEIGRAHV